MNMHPKCSLWSLRDVDHLDNFPDKKQNQHHPKRFIHYYYQQSAYCFYNQDQYEWNVFKYLFLQKYVSNVPLIVKVPYRKTSRLTFPDQQEALKFSFLI